MERQYEEGLTAGELGRMIVKRLWIVILAAIAVAALLTAAFALSSTRSAEITRWSSISPTRGATR